jgi:hypothetical protein
MCTQWLVELTFGLAGVLSTVTMTGTVGAEELQRS